MKSPTTSTKCQSRKGFTLIELLVVIAIIAILAAILFPVFARARENARRSSCQSNMKQVGLGILQYAQDFDERNVPVQIQAPDADTPWQFLIQSYVKSTQVMRCPSSTSKLLVYHTGGTWTSPEVFRSYYINAGDESTSTVGGKRPYVKLLTGGTATVSLASLNNPSTTISVCELQGAQDDPKADRRSFLIDASTKNAFINHLGMTNFLFIDGHVKALKPTVTATADIDMWTNTNGTGSTTITPGAPSVASTGWQDVMALAETQLQ